MIVMMTGPSEAYPRMTVQMVWEMMQAAGSVRPKGQNSGYSEPVQHPQIQAVARSSKQQCAGRLHLDSSRNCKGIAASRH